MQVPFLLYFRIVRLTYQANPRLHVLRKTVETRRQPEISAEEEVMISLEALDKIDSLESILKFKMPSDTSFRMDDGVLTIYLHAARQ